MEQYNYKILSIVLRHFFSDIEGLTIEEDVISYYFKFVDLVSSNEESWDNFEDYLIWEPFENYYPKQILALMEDMYFDIQHTLELNCPNVVINPIEIASELASEDIKESFTELDLSYEVEDEDGNITYTDAAQTVFNELFDKYINSIVK